MATQHQTTPQTEPYELAVPLDGTSYAVRENLQDILERELIGPSRGEEEVIDVSPKTKYILGRIAPATILPDKEDTAGLPYLSAIGDTDGEDAGDDDDSGSFDAGEDEAGSSGAYDSPQRSGLLIPSSMGLRFQVPRDLDRFTVHCSWGTYRSVKGPEDDSADDKKQKSWYQRTHFDKAIDIRPAELSEGRTVDRTVDGSVTLRIDRYDDAVRDRYLIEVALCNDEETERKVPIGKWMFQTKLDVDAGGRAVFLPVHDWTEDESFADIDDAEERRIALQYRNRLEFAIGRTCSADWTVRDGERRATSVRTTWLPTAEIPQTLSKEVEGAQLDMTALAHADAAMVRDGLSPIADEYRTWLDGQDSAIDKLPEHLRKTARDAVRQARQVLTQLEEGIEFLAGDEEALRCFRFMNRVMADQRIHTQVAALRAKDAALSIADAERQVEKGKFPHHWRVFQIAFILMQVKALTVPTTERRSAAGLAARAQLLFFPTGGGKTEAYLGLAAYAFAIRRRQGVVESSDGPLDGTAGVTVLMRYTLRLLTSQQFQRAAALVCAAELERRRHPDVWGNEPFRIGLWVGTNVTPKRIKEAAQDIASKRQQGSHRNPDVLQIAACPWCGAPLDGNDVRADETLGRILVHCSNRSGECPFALGGEIEEGIPVLTTDEEIYRLVPAFVIATVDKFARLAREGAAASLFGYVGRKCSRHGYVPVLDQDGGCDYPECAVKTSHSSRGRLPKASVRPTQRLRPPDLIIQDELHLITGSLGTTVGLFETAIDTLCSWDDAQGRGVRPMVVASSATMRNATEQIRNLYARGTTVFPPQVLDASDTFFSQEEPCSSEHPGRRYVGVSTTGVRLSNAEIQTAETLMKGAQLLMDTPNGGNATDPYMTLVAYFSTTRELAGMARFMQDDIATHVRRGRVGSHLPIRRGADFHALRVGELTSRVASSNIVATLNRMGVPFDYRYESVEAWRNVFAAIRSKKKPRFRPDDHPFDAVLATSMLQVGVDVPRLGLMMVVGQPKNTAEYIQASSRVGRDPRRPGLVVTVDNWARPRDLAHFEQFRAYHESFYARVEPLSVTPFSMTSLERGVAGLFISAARVLQGNDGGGLNPEHNAGLVDTRKEFLTDMVGRLVERIRVASASDSDSNRAKQLLTNVLERWQNYERQERSQGRMLAYERVQENDPKYVPLIRSSEDAGSADTRMPDPRFPVANSMREVQPEINILVTPDQRRMAFQEPEGCPQWTARPQRQQTKDTSTTEEGENS